MTRLIALTSLVLLAGCATPRTASGPLPAQAPPFVGDQPIYWPTGATGQLLVTAFPKAASSTSAGKAAPWRVYNAAGAPLGPVYRKSAALELPAGEYVILARDAERRLRSVQVVVRTGEVTPAPLARICGFAGSSLEDSAPHGD